MSLYQIDAWIKKKDKMKKILITGAMGFVGSNLSRILQNILKDSFIIGIDNFLSSERIYENEKNLDIFINGAVEDNKILKLLDLYNIDTVFHLATYHGNSTSVLNPIEDHQNGALTTIKLLDYFQKKQLNRFVYSSAGCSMGTADEENCKFIEEVEEVTLKLDTPYQISKIVGEFYCNFYFKQFGVPTIRARFQNVYGPGEILGAGRWRGSDATIWRNVIPIFIYKALKNLPLIIYGLGEESRDFIYVEDIVDGLIRCASAEGVAGDVFNLSCGVQTTIKDLAELIVEKTNSTSKIILKDKRDWDSAHQRFASTKKAEKILNFKAMTSLEDGIVKTIKWTNANLDIIEKTIKKHEGRHE